MHPEGILIKALDGLSEQIRRLIPGTPFSVTHDDFRQGVLIRFHRIDGTMAEVEISGRELLSHRGDAALARHLEKVLAPICEEMQLVILLEEIAM